MTDLLNETYYGPLHLWVHRCRWSNNSLARLDEFASSNSTISGDQEIFEKFLLNESIFGIIGCTLSGLLLSFMIYLKRKRRLEAIRHVPLLLGMMINDIITGLVITGSALSLMKLTSYMDAPWVQRFVTHLRSLRNTAVVTPVGPCVSYIVIAVSQCIALAKPFLYEVHLTKGLFKCIAIISILAGLSLWCVIFLIRCQVDHEINEHQLGQDASVPVFWTKLEYLMVVSFLYTFIMLTIATFVIVSCILYKRARWNSSKQGRLIRLLRIEVCVYCCGALVVAGCSIAYYEVTLRLLSFYIEDCALLILNYVNSFDLMHKTTIVQNVAIQVWLLRLVVEPILHLFCNRNVRFQLLVLLGLKQDNKSQRCNTTGREITETSRFLERESKSSKSEFPARCSKKIRLENGESCFSGLEEPKVELT